MLGCILEMVLSWHSSKIVLTIISNLEEVEVVKELAREVFIQDKDQKLPKIIRDIIKNHSKEWARDHSQLNNIRGLTQEEAKALKDSIRPNPNPFWTPKIH